MQNFSFKIHTLDYQTSFIPAHSLIFWLHQDTTESSYYLCTIFPPCSNACPHFARDSFFVHSKLSSIPLHNLPSIYPLENKQTNKQLPTLRLLYASTWEANCNWRLKLHNHRWAHFKVIIRNHWHHPESYYILFFHLPGRLFHTFSSPFLTLSWWSFLFHGENWSHQVRTRMPSHNISQPVSICAGPVSSRIAVEEWPRSTEAHPFPSFQEYGASNFVLSSLHHQSFPFHRIIPGWIHAFAAAKSLQSCLTLCNPIGGSPTGSSVPGILQVRTLEWVAIAFSNAWKWKVKVKSLSRVRPSATPWTAAFQAPLSMGFSRQEYWSGLPLPSPYMLLFLPYWNTHTLLSPYLPILLLYFKTNLWWARGVLYSAPSHHITAPLHPRCHLDGSDLLDASPLYPAMSYLLWDLQMQFRRHKTWTINKSQSKF